MGIFIVSLVLLIVLLIVGMLEKFYGSIPAAELKRRANKGDGRASLLHEVVRNSGFARAYLLTIAIGLFALIISISAAHLSRLQLFLLIPGVFVLWELARSRSRVIQPLAVKIAPRFAYFIVLTKPYTAVLHKIASKIVRKEDKTVVFSKEDLIALLQKQKDHTVSPNDKAELDLVLHALSFSGKVVKDYMTPRKVVRFVKSDEAVSPVLMDELYQTGFSRFPVYLDEVDNIIGTLYLRDLVDRKMSGRVFSAMIRDVYEVDEGESLEAVLKKILKTKHHLFIVKNEFGETVGVITIEDIIEQILGKKIIDEFDLHDDMRTFAKESAGDKPTA